MINKSQGKTLSFSITAHGFALPEEGARGKDVKEAIGSNGCASQILSLNRLSRMSYPFHNSS